MADNPEAVEIYYKTQNLAYLSYLGLLIPLVGIILGALARSRLKILVPNNDEDYYQLERLGRIANWGYGLSWAGLALQILGIVLWGVYVGSQLGTVQ